MNRRVEFGSKLRSPRCNCQYPSKVLLDGILRVSSSNLSWLGLALLRAVLGGPLTAADSAMAPGCVIHSGRTVDSSQFVLSYLELVSRSRAGEDREPSNFVSSVFDGKIKVCDTRRPHFHRCRRPDLRDSHCCARWRSGPKGRAGANGAACACIGPY